MRIIGWESALAAVIAKHRALPFEWGVSDCFTLPLDGITAITGADPWAGLHDYDSRIGAARCLAVQGFANIGDGFAATFTEQHPAFAQRGDVGVIESDGAICGALFVANGVAGKTETGLHFFPRARVVRAFKVR